MLFFGKRCVETLHFSGVSEDYKGKIAIGTLLAWEIFFCEDSGC